MDKVFYCINMKFSVKKISNSFVPKPSIKKSCIKCVDATKRMYIKTQINVDKIAIMSVSLGVVYPLLSGNIIPAT